MAKLKAGRLLRETNDACLQFHFSPAPPPPARPSKAAGRYWGGMGYMASTLVSRAYRDSRLCSIGGGADEVMLEIIGKMKGF